MKRGEEPRPILREPRFVSHEWWDPDGEHVWCVDVGNDQYVVFTTTVNNEVDLAIVPVEQLIQATL
jgi:hypothetical protein